jgi:hypothetical protein
MTIPTLNQSLDFDAPRRLAASGIADPLLASACLQDEHGFDLPHMLWAFARHTQTKREVIGLATIIGSWADRDGMASIPKWRGRTDGRHRVDSGFIRTINQNPGLLSEHEIKCYVLAMFPEATIMLQSSLPITQWQDYPPDAEKGLVKDFVPPVWQSKETQPPTFRFDREAMRVYASQIVAPPDFLIRYPDANELPAYSHISPMTFTSATSQIWEIPS